MPKAQQKREADDATVGAAESGSQATEKKQRFHERGGRLFPVVRTYFDKRTNRVVDVYEKSKVVQNRRGDDIETKTYIHVTSQDEKLQTKYRQDANTMQVEVSDE